MTAQAQKNEVQIRPAKPGDEAEIANVQLNSWREAYRGLLPQDYLDQQPLLFKLRKNWFEKAITQPQKYILQVAECKKNGIVGFAIFESGRDPEMENLAELAAIYLFEIYKKQEIGFKLLSTGLKQMKARGFQKAYCWVIEGNPTIHFYKRTGAKFNGRTKEVAIGGQNVKELCYEWDDLSIGDYGWQPFSVDQVIQLFQNMKSEWSIAGGWAIDLFLDKVTRDHEDIDVIIQRENQFEIKEALTGWELWVADPPGTLRPWKTGEYLGKGIQDIWCRQNANDPWRIQIMLFDVEKGDWIFKRDESIRRKLESVILKSKQGPMVLSAEIQLLYKSKSLRDKDKMDFESALPFFNETQKKWLKEKLIHIYQNQHEWIDRL